MLNLRYRETDTKENVLKILKEEGEKVCLTAGATNVLPYIESKALSDKTLVNIKDIKELSGISENVDVLIIGAATTIAEIEKAELVKNNALSLYQAAQDFADPITRNNATIGGNIADASPASDTSPALLAMDAVIVVESLEQGVRRIPISEFFLGVRKTALQANELITSIEITKNDANKKSQFIKMGLRKSMAISVATIAVSADIKDKKIREINVAVGSCAPTPIRASHLEDFLNGKDFNEDNLNAAALEIVKDINPIDDIRATAEYRKEVVPQLFLKAFKRILALQ